jgi:hypothetical protein
VLYFSNNFRRFKLERTPLPNLPSCEITARTIGPDFERNARIHRAWELKRLVGAIPLVCEGRAGAEMRKRVQAPRCHEQGALRR